ncbi:MAG: hypothetical protein JWP02_3872 [Acidimicrobiales bacterium]|nr:hypothetical protein [Acidimicrobiales bacterium]
MSWTEPGLRARVSLLLAALLALCGLTAAAPPPQRARLSLTSQTPWVQPGGALRLGLHIDAVTDPGALELALSTYARLPSRSAFDLTVQGRSVGSLIDVTTMPLSDLGVDDNGNFSAALQFQDPAAPRDASRLLLSHEGVYPLRVELREKGGGAVLDRFTTHIPYLPATRTGTKLDVAWVLPVHAPPAIRPDGTRRLTNVRDILTLGQVLEAAPTVPVTVAPTPETVQALATTSDGSAALAALRRGLSRRQVVTGAYVPTNLPALIAGDGGGEADAEIQRGGERLTESLRVPVDSAAWVSEEPLDDASMARLRDRGITQVALPETSLTPLQSRLTLSRTYLLDAHQGRRQQAVSVDPGLAGHFQNTGNQVLAAHQLLADLAVLYFDQPGGQQRGVVALTPRSWRPDKAFLETALAGLGDSPVVDPVSLTTLFGNVDKLRGGNGAPLVRRMAGPPRNASTPTGTKSVRQRLTTFRSIVDRDNPVYDALDEQLLASHSADLRSSRQRTYVTGVERGVDRQLQRIQAPAGGSIRLTARGGQIPVTFRNDTGYPVHVVATIRSDKLEFPGAPPPRASPSGAAPNEITRRLDLLRRNETERFSVQTRASGAFPLLVTLASPDGSLVVSRSTLTVRSTAASGLGLFLSGAAGLFLLAWWGRHALHGRRARKLVPV